MNNEIHAPDPPRRAARGVIVLLLWLLALGALGAYSAWQLRISSDLRAFLPAPRTSLQHLLLRELGQGAGARTLLLAIRTPDAERAAALSSALRARLIASGQFNTVQNGSGDLQQIAPALLPYRYLLAPTLDHQRFDAAYLRSELEQRLDDLGAPGAGVLKPLLPSDPTLETLKLAERWAPRHAPPLRHGVWYADSAALLLLETRAAGFDPDAQARAVRVIEQAWAGLPQHAQAHLELSGPGYFGVVVQALTRHTAEHLGWAAGGGLVLLLLLAYRSVRAVLLAALPLLSAALVGTTVLALVFGGAHGLTLAFGITLLGVAQEYPLRLLSHRRIGEDPRASARALGPVLLLAMASTAIAYLAFFASGVAGLQQLALFTLSGILAAGLSTRYLLPILLPVARRDAGAQRWLTALAHGLTRLPRARVFAVLLALAAVFVLLLAPGPWWQNNLAALTPVPLPLLQREGVLRKALGAPDVRYLLVLEGDSAEQVLRHSAAAAPAFAPLLAQGALDTLMLPSTYLPPLAVQRARQARLPDRAQLQTALDQALRGLPYRAGLFAPFVRDVEIARTLPLLTPQAFERTPLGGLLRALLIERHGRWFGLGLVGGVRDPAALARAAQATHGLVRLVDLKTETESWVASYRQRILAALGGAALLLIAVVTLGLRRWRAVLRVLAALALALLLALAALRLLVGALNLFHLVALLLAAGLGLHYALFFERARHAAADERLRTLHATLLCAASTLLAFGVYALASLPVLRALGLTVTLGIAANLLAAALLTWPRATPPAC